MGPVPFVPHNSYSPPSALYVHVPVCASKCAYCDFYSLPIAVLGEKRLTATIEATIVRANELAERFGAAGFTTVYIGGGTPTALSEKQLEHLLRGIGTLAGSPKEWTIEANPESMGPSKLGVMRECGIDRISLGVQSLDEVELSILGRPHDAASALEALRLALGSHARVSADLMAGLPSKPGKGGPSGLVDSVTRLLDLGLEHLSLYDIVIEEGTGIANALAEGALVLPDEDRAFDERAEAESLIERFGLRRYEVSNYALPGSECRHNLVYWNMESYVGAGPGAVSTLAASPRKAGARAGVDGGSLRIEEAKRICTGVADPEDTPPVETSIAPREASVETFIMAFRTTSGLDLASFERRFGLDFRKLVPASLASWTHRMVERDGFLSLDREGSNLLNRFLVDCMVELERNYPAAS